MKRWEAWSLHVLTLVLTATGLAYFWMKYLMETDDPFSAINHPWEAFMLKAHILAAPLLVLAVGMMIQSHIVKKARNGNGKAGLRSGMASLVLFALMVGSGYALQVVSDPGIFRGVMIVHLLSGVLFALVYVAHQIVGLLLIRRSERKKAACRLAA